MKNKIAQKGFTLVELLVSLFVFSLVITMSLTAVLTVLDANKKAQSLKSVMNNLNFAIESMNRDLRYGSRYNCGGGSSTPNDCINGAATIRVKSDRDVNGNAADPSRTNGDDYIEYRLVSNSSDSGFQIERALSLVGNGGNIMGDFIPITAPEIHVEKMRFYVTGTSLADGIQPKIRVIIQGYAGTKPNTKSSFSLQTTISQRCFNVSGRSCNSL